MARDLNGTIKNDRFDLINMFSRHSGGEPHIGDVIDIDILGPLNGSVILVASDTLEFHAPRASHKSER